MCICICMNVNLCVCICVCVCVCVHMCCLTFICKYVSTYVHDFGTLCLLTNVWRSLHLVIYSAVTCKTIRICMLSKSADFDQHEKICWVTKCSELACANWFEATAWRVRASFYICMLFSAQQSQTHGLRIWHFSEYESWNHPLNGEVTQICPKFLVLKCPVDIRAISECWDEAFREVLICLACTMSMYVYAILCMYVCICIVQVLRWTFQGGAYMLRMHVNENHEYVCTHARMQFQGPLKRCRIV
jgi:hypothetical protein